MVSNNWSTKCYYDFAPIVVSGSSVCVSITAAAVATITTTTATGSQS